MSRTKKSKFYPYGSYCKLPKSTYFPIVYIENNNTEIPCMYLKYGPSELNRQLRIIRWSKSDNSEYKKRIPWIENRINRLKALKTLRKEMYE